MATKDALGYLLVAGAAAGGSWYFFENQIGLLQGRIEQLEAQRFAEYGVLSAVNRMQLAVQPASYKCRHTDKQGFGKGTIHYEWSTEFAYGIDVQGYDWAANVTRVDEHTLKVRVPKLIQLNPIKVEFDDFIEVNEASGNRWERMYGKVVDVAHNWMGRDAEHLPYAIPEIVTTARQQLARQLRSLLNADRPADRKIREVIIEFSTPYPKKAKAKLKFDRTCKYI